MVESFCVSEYKMVECKCYRKDYVSVSLCMFFCVSYPEKLLSCALLA